LLSRDPESRLLVLDGQQRLRTLQAFTAESTRGSRSRLKQYKSGWVDGAGLGECRQVRNTSFAMAELPTGTVTLLFTDIEGSTHLLKTLGDDYERALSDHRALLRRAFNLSGGQIVDRQGDAFFVVFRRAKDAVTAAIEAQRSLASHPWPEGSELRVRMGIHTGEPSVSDEGLTGLAVHLAARICAVAQGQQVLVSDTTRGLIEEELPSGSRLRDLGKHILKDFDRPMRLFQLVAEGLGDSFSPLRLRTPPPDEGLSPEEKEYSVTRAEDSYLHRPERRRMGPLIALRLGDRFRALRRRRGGESIVFIGSRIHSMSQLSPSPELGTALVRLGGAVMQGGRCLRDARRLLTSVDRRALQRRLDTLRDGRLLSTEEARLADDIARQVDALDRLADLRPKLRVAIERIDSRANEIRQEVFAARLGHPVSDSLIDEVKTLSESMLTLCRQAHQAEEAARPAAVWYTGGKRKKDT
jgi:class 3 adenylate cyclase